MDEIREIPVYLFTGFLGAGKTTFIQDTLESDEFNKGERTLLLLTEEGEVEYEPDRFFEPERVYIETIEDEEDFTTSRLALLATKHSAERVVIEYNGMWSLDTLYRNMPQEWLVYQEMCFIDAETFKIYNQNMRQQMFDKLKSGDPVIFNRCKRTDDLEEVQMEMHKEVRIANRRSQILYEFGPDDVMMDDIEDPLPYDMNAPVIDIAPDMYAEWYRDINEHQDNYEGKELRVVGRVATGGGLKKNEFIFGRHVMTCCVQDIQFAGLLCKWTDEAETIPNGAWVKIRCTVRNEYTPVYQEVGPVLHCATVAPHRPLDPEVATF